MSFDKLAIEAKGLTKTFTLSTTGGDRPLYHRLGGERKKIRTALDHISFTLAPGKALAVMGRNGSGKSTLLKILAGIVDPTEGEAILHGQVGALLEVGAGAHPDLTGWENLRLVARLLQVPTDKREEYYDRAASFCALGEKLNEPTRWYSAGQYARLGFAMAAMAPTDILLIDEALGAGDVMFQMKCFDFFYAAKAQGRAFVMVSHATAALRDLCDDGLVLNNGQPVYTGSVASAIEHYDRIAFS
ncbi:MAG: ABC transporter ATP-binding protein [Robiginitomaculum sp.]|nr:ABC transporter ATP-binding protein [Robiginitomaculum sp.]MDQ7076316.1 ABC transporter ATP-binding protein [Robiginitomaculum sp.]